MADSTTLFWKAVARNARRIVGLMRTFDRGDAEYALRLLNTIASKYYPIDVGLTINLRNGVELPERAGHVVMHISPKGSRDEIPRLNKLYNDCPEDLADGTEIPEFSVVKYRPWIPSQRLDPIVIDGLTIDSSCFEYSSHFAVDREDRSVVLNLIIFVRNDVADKILEPRDVIFAEPAAPAVAAPVAAPTSAAASAAASVAPAPASAAASAAAPVAPTSASAAMGPVEPTRRRVLIPKNNVLEQFLYDAIGEANIMKCLGNIEFLYDKTDGVRTHPKLLRSEWYTMLERVSMVSKRREKCMRCGLTEDFVTMFECVGGCAPPAMYCSEVCRVSHEPVHKNFCGK